MGHHSDRRTSCLGRRCVIGYPLSVVSFRSYVRIPLPPLVFSSIIWKVINHTFTVPWFLFLLSLGGWCDGSSNGTSHTFPQWQPKVTKGLYMNKGFVPFTTPRSPSSLLSHPPHPLASLLFPSYPLFIVRLPHHDSPIKVNPSDSRHPRDHFQYILGSVSISRRMKRKTPRA